MLSEREFAARVGASLSTIQRHRRLGLLPGAHQDERGRWRIPPAAVAGFAKQLQVKTPKPARPEPDHGPAAALTDRMNAVLAEMLQALAEQPIDDVIAGAREALEERHGRAPTPAEIEAALFDRPALDWLEAALGLWLAEDDGLPPEERAAMARQTGREMIEEA